MKIEVEGDLFRVILRWKLRSDQEDEAFKENIQEESDEEFRKEPEPVSSEEHDPEDSEEYEEK